MLPHETDDFLLTCFAVRTFKKLSDCLQCLNTLVWFIENKRSTNQTNKKPLFFPLHLSIFLLFTCSHVNVSPLTVFLTIHPTCASEVSHQGFSAAFFFFFFYSRDILHIWSTTAKKSANRQSSCLYHLSKASLSLSLHICYI